MLIRLRKAQTTLEYAVLIAVVAGGLIAMQVYMKRAFQGSIQSSSDDMGEQFSIDGMEKLNYSYHSKGDTHESFKTGVTQSTVRAGGEISESWSNVSLKNFTAETWEQPE